MFSLFYVFIRMSFIVSLSFALFCDYCLLFSDSFHLYKYLHVLSFYSCHSYMYVGFSSSYIIHVSCLFYGPSIFSTCTALFIWLQPFSQFALLLVTTVPFILLMCFQQCICEHFCEYVCQAFVLSIHQY